MTSRDELEKALERMEERVAVDGEVPSLAEFLSGTCDPEATRWWSLRDLLDGGSATDDGDADDAVRGGPR